MVDPRGQLRAELGIDDISRLDTILQVWLDSIKVDLISFRVAGNGLTGGLTIHGCGLKDATDLDSYLASRIRLKEGEWPFMKVLLTAGSSVVVNDYGFFPANSYEAPYSRSGVGIMRSGINRRWSVPAWAAGTISGDNFVTRALQGFDIFLSRAMNEVWR